MEHRPAPQDAPQEEWLGKIFAHYGAKYGLTEDETRKIYMTTFRRIRFHMYHTMGFIRLPGLGILRPIKYRIESILKKYIKYKKRHKFTARQKMEILFKARRYNDFKTYREGRHKKG